MYLPEAVKITGLGESHTGDTWLQDPGWSSRLPSAPAARALPIGEQQALELPDLRRELQLIILTMEQTTEPCTPTYWKRTCMCGSSIVRTGCMNANCPNCQEKVTKRRATRALRRIDSVRKGRALLYTIFTIPPELRKTYTTRKQIGELARKVWKVLKKKYRGQFALSASHPHGDVHQGESGPELFHPHLNLCWIQLPGSSPFLDVEALRADYRQILELEPGAPVDLRTAYHTEPEKIYHTLKYATRTFPGFSHWCGSMRWLGQYPRKVEDPGACSCPKCGQFYLVERSNVWDYQQFKIQEALARHHLQGGTEDAAPMAASHLSWHQHAQGDHNDTRRTAGTGQGQSYAATPGVVS